MNNTIRITTINAAQDMMVGLTDTKSCVSILPLFHFYYTERTQPNDQLVLQDYSNFNDILSIIFSHIKFTIYM